MILVYSWNTCIIKDIFSRILGLEKTLYNHNMNYNIKARQKSF